MLLYTSFTYDIFKIIVATLQRFEPLNYYSGWNVTNMSLEDQVLITLMKLRLNLRDLDLADRFSTSRATISNIVNTIICALHEIFYKGIMVRVGMPSQLKCKGSMPKSFEDFGSARASIDCTEITQDVPSDFNRQSASYSNYKSRHTVKALLHPTVHVYMFHRCILDLCRMPTLLNIHIFWKTLYQEILS